MGCFLACFGSSKDRNRRKQRHRKVQPRDQINVDYNPSQSVVPLVQENCPEQQSSSQVNEIRDDELEEKLSLSTRKKVTFDSNVKTYEHISVGESTDFSVEKEDGGIREGKEEETRAKPRQSHSSSEDSSGLSSVGSYPPNHRYQNCRDSDDELDYEESDIDNGEVDDDDEDSEDDGGIDYDIYEDDAIAESSCRGNVAKVVVSQENDSSVVSGLTEREMNLNRNARDRGIYAHPVLNPVENLSQWKAVKAKGMLPLRHQKENLILDQEVPRVLLSSEPSFAKSSFSFKTVSDQPKKSTQEVAVDASLSNWLGWSESTILNKPSTTGLDTISPEKTMSLGSNSPRSFDDRPILGALTLEELKQFSASNSPRKSPSRSPDEMPIIGTVGSYWNHSDSVKDSGSISSYKGIPNTTSKYREDKRVNWHSTPLYHFVFDIIFFAATCRSVLVNSRTFSAVQRRRRARHFVFAPKSWSFAAASVHGAF